MVSPLVRRVFIGGLGFVLLFTPLVGLYSLKMEVVEITDDAMVPTLFPRDTALLWRTDDFELGDIVVCRGPYRADLGDRYVAARLIGRPGQTVEIERGTELRIAGQTPDRDYRGTLEWGTGPNRRMRWGIEVILDHEHLFAEPERGNRPLSSREVSTGYFVLNDNRRNQTDSRTFGEIDPATCIGTLFMRVQAGGQATGVPSGSLDLLE